MTERWSRCLAVLDEELPKDEFHTWVRPLQAREQEGRLMLLAPNALVLEAFTDRHLARVLELLQQIDGDPVEVKVEIGSARAATVRSERSTANKRNAAKPANSAVDDWVDSRLDARYTFANFVEGKSNELGKATAMQVAAAPAQGNNNPLLLYGGTGLGKTHLLHATGSLMRSLRPKSKVLYLRSEQFVSAMIRALRQGQMDGFKSAFRSVDALLIDDIQFFAGKDRTQEEFFHTFNALFEAKHQIILACDRYPKEVEGLEPRLKSRFGWGLSVAIEPPDFETRANILITKAQAIGVELPEAVAFLIAKRMRSNVRDLEGALNTLCARSNFTGRAITLEFAQETLRDLLTVHDQLITLGNIQKTVAEFYQLRVADLLSRRRTRSIARPRQVAMALAKELTDHSLPEIGDGFGGRDHTTVLHACRTVRGLVETDGRMREEWNRLLRMLSGEG